MNKKLKAIINLIITKIKIVQKIIVVLSQIILIGKKLAKLVLFGWQLFLVQCMFLDY